MLDTAEPLCLGAARVVRRGVRRRRSDCGRRAGGVGGRSADASPVSCRPATSGRSPARRRRRRSSGARTVARQRPPMPQHRRAGCGRRQPAVAARPRPVRDRLRRVHGSRRRGPADARRARSRARRLLRRAPSGRRGACCPHRCSGPHRRSDRSPATSVVRRGWCTTRSTSSATVDGVWHVVQDLTDAPSGLGYTLLNRSVLARVVPDGLRGGGRGGDPRSCRPLRRALIAAAPPQRRSPRSWSSRRARQIPRTWSTPTSPCSWACTSSRAADLVMRKRSRVAACARRPRADRRRVPAPRGRGPRPARTRTHGVGSGVPGLITWCADQAGRAGERVRQRASRRPAAGSRISPPPRTRLLGERRCRCASSATATPSRPRRCYAGGDATRSPRARRAARCRSRVEADGMTVHARRRRPRARPR